MALSPLQETLADVAGVLRTQGHVQSAEAQNIAREILETLAVQGFLGDDLKNIRHNGKTSHEVIRDVLRLAGVDASTHDIIVKKIIHQLSQRGILR